MVWGVRIHSVFWLLSQDGTLESITTRENIINSTLKDPHVSLSIIAFRNFLDDCLVWTPWQCYLEETREGTRNSVFPKRVTLYLVGGKLRRWSCQAEPRTGPRPRKIRRLSWEKANWGILKQNWKRRILPDWLRNNVAQVHVSTGPNRKHRAHTKLTAVRRD